MSEHYRYIVVLMFEIMKFEMFDTGKLRYFLASEVL